MKRFACLMLVVTAACGSKKTPTIAKGQNFSFSIPTGWEPVEAGVPAGGIAIQQKERSYDGYFLGSIAVLPMPLKPSLDVSSEDLCERVAAMVASNEKTTLKSAQIVDGPNGRTCQIDMSDVGNHSALVTIVRSPTPGVGEAWSVTCNHDPRDDRAVTDCRNVLASWKFE